MGKFARVCLTLAGVLGIIGISACATGPEPIKAVYSIKSSAQLNPDNNNRPSPVVVRFYELQSPGMFESAEFFALYSDEAKTLGKTLIARKEVQVWPSENRDITEELQPGTRAIGIVAAFRNLSSNKWRSVIPVVEGKPVSAQVTLETTSIFVKTKP